MFYRTCFFYSQVSFSSVFQHWKILILRISIESFIFKTPLSYLHCMANNISNNIDSSNFFFAKLKFDPTIPSIYTQSYGCQFKEFVTFCICFSLLRNKSSINFTSISVCITPDYGPRENFLRLLSKSSYRPSVVLTSTN